MNPERWRRIEEIYHAAMEQPPEKRTSFLIDDCQGDDELLREVRTLLAQSDSSGELSGLVNEAAGLIEQTQFREGTLLGPYRIEGTLGAGGMGQVYRASDPRLGRAVAIKVTAQQFSERFEHEARAISALNHPHICTVYDVGPNYLVMELVEGETLAARLRKGALSTELVLRYGAQIADAVAAAHTKGLVHRDLKPGNIMVTETGQVKVLDFGLAKISQGVADHAAESATKEGTVVGTVAYMSPEQAEGKKVDARSDIFSFGAVLYEMIAGKQPFRGDSALSTLTAILREEPKPLRGEIPSELERLVKRCLRKDPDRRWQHMADLRVALEELKQDSESGKLSAAVGTSRRSSWPWLLAMLAVAATLGAWVLLRNRQTPAVGVNPVPVTAYRGSEFSPTLSPDGKQVAFVWGGEANDNMDIYVAVVTGGTAPPLRLTTDPAADTSPAWSPDGSQIAFYRGDSVYLVSPLGGPERRLVNVAPTDILVLGGFYADRPASLAWSPDGKWLAVTDRASEQHAPGAALINVSTGEKRHLTKPLLPLQADVYYTFSPDGAQLAFARFENSSVSDIYELPLAGGEPVRLTKRNRVISGLAWVPGTQEIAFTSQGVFLRMPARAGAEPTQPLRTEGSIESFAISQSGRLVYTQTLVDTNIWEKTIGDSAPRQVVASTRPDTYPQASPDGSRIAFSSRRSGSNEIWVSDRDGKNLVQLTALGGSAQSAHWSPDGKLLVFSCLLNDNRDIYTIRPDGGAARRLTSDQVEEGRPRISRDGRWIYFYSYRSGSVQIWKMPVDGGSAIQVTRKGGHEAEESWDGRTLYFTSLPAPGLRSMPAQGGEEKMENPAVRSGQWEATQKGIVYLGGDATGGRYPILLWDPLRRSTTQLALINGRLGVFGGSRVFFASQDAARFLWTQVDREESDLMLVENIR